MRACCYAVPLVLLVSCATTPPPPHLEGKAAPPRYPGSTHLSAAGESRESLVQAEAGARAELIKKISLRVSEVFEQVEEERSAGSASAGTRSTAVRLRQESEFSRANLIEIAERGSYGGRHFALAVLSREKAGAALAEDYRAVAAGFREAVALARRDEARPAAFTSAYRQAMAGYATLRPLGLELAAVDPAREEEVRGDLRLLGELRASRARVLQTVAVRVVTTGARSDAAEKVSGALARELSALGIRVDPSAKGSTLELSVDEAWPRGMGVCCQWSPRFALDGQPLRLELNIVGCDPRDKARAREDAAAQLTPEVLRPALRSALSVLVPLEE